MPDPYYNLNYRPETKRQYLELLRVQLENERSSFIPHWRDLGDFILPRRPRFFLSDANRGERRNQKIIDTTATLAVRTLQSGMMAGITSPARPWFRLTTPDPELGEFAPVKEWLHVVAQRMATVFLRSNLYNALPIVYGDLGVFATGAVSIEEDFESVVRFYPFPIGSYMIANNDRLKVDVFFREFRMTVRQIVNRFGRKAEEPSKIDWTNMSAYVRNLWENGQVEAWVDIAHAIIPNDDYRPRAVEAKYKRYLSCYYERGSSGVATGSYVAELDGEKILSQSGYDYFPILCPRWEITGEDVYGTNCPGMTALGDIRQLQIGEKRGAQAIEKMVNPPMVAPTALRTMKTTILPGDITYSDEREGQRGFRPAHEVNFRIAELEAKQDQVRQRIRRAFYEDLFLMLATIDRRQITAREIDERHEEKLLMLGPVLEQLNQDLLDPLIDNTFDIMLRQGLIPRPPEELQGTTLKVEYISIMAQAQKLAGIGGIERFAGFVGQIAGFDPQVLDKIDRDQMVDEYGEITSVPPRIIVPDEQVAAIRQARVEAAQAQQAAAMAADAARTVKDLSSAKMGEDNALTRLEELSRAGAITP